MNFWSGLRVIIVTFFKNSIMNASQGIDMNTTNHLSKCKNLLLRAVSCLAFESLQYVDNYQPSSIPILNSTVLFAYNDISAFLVVPFIYHRHIHNQVKINHETYSIAQFMSIQNYPFLNNNPIQVSFIVIYLFVQWQCLIV